MNPPHKEGIGDLMQHPKYRPDIDGLRAIAVVSVVGFHAFPKLIPGGFAGVDIFFVISGFLISTIIFGSLADKGFSYIDFYTRRIRRIFPALIVVLAASGIVGWFALMSDDYARLGKHIAAGGGFVANIALWMESNYFDGDANTKPLLHLWSLGIEEQFYIIWPVMAGIAWRYRFSFLTLAAATIALTFSVCLWDTFNDPTAGYYSPLSRFWELAVGGVLAYLQLHKPQWLSGKKNWQAAFGFGFIAAGFACIDKYSAFPGWFAWLPVLGSFLIISAGPNAWLNQKILARSGMVWIGLISYPLYLWHWPLLSFAHIVEGADKLPRLLRIVCVAASFVLAWITYRFIERPLKQTDKPRRQALILAGAMAILVATGIAVYAAQGFEHRAINNDPRNVFIKKYRDMHKQGLFAYYREECDFYDYRTDGAKPGISQDCLQKGSRKTYLLWGDSHAQALSSGIRNMLPPDTKLAQITASGCRPALRVIPKNGANIEACTKANAFAIEQIKSLRPDIVIATQAASHEETDWDEIADMVEANGGKLVVVGPTPRWRPSLPDIIVQHHWGQPLEYTDIGIDKPLFETDRLMKEKYPAGSEVNYVSALDKLCKANGCLARIDTDEELDLFAVDDGHMTPAASDHVARHILKAHLK